MFKNETEGIFDLTGKLIQVIQNQNTLTVQHLTPGNYIVKNHKRAFVINKIIAC